MFLAMALRLPMRRFPRHAGEHPRRRGEAAVANVDVLVHFSRAVFDPSFAAVPRATLEFGTRLVSTRRTRWPAAPRNLPTPQRRTPGTHSRLST